MPTTPYAKLQVIVNGGGAESGGVIVENGDVVQLTAQSFGDWGANTATPVAKWQIYGKLDGFTLPSGWTLDTDETYVFFGNEEPPPFTMPASTWWGKLSLRLFVDGGVKNGHEDLAELLDESTMLEIVGPSGIHDVAQGETTDFSPFSPYGLNGVLSDDLHTLAASGGTISGADPVVVSSGVVSLTDVAKSSLQDWRPLVRVVIASNVSLAACSTTQDSLTLVAGDLVILIGQTAGAQNGVYVVGTVSAGTAPLTRVSWMSSSADLVSGMRIPIGPEGTLGGKATLMLSTVAPMTLGTTALVFDICSIPGASVTAPITNSSTGVKPNYGISAATAGAAGSMSAADKAKLDAATASPTLSTLVLRDASAGIKAAYLDSGAASDLLLKRNAITKVTIGSTQTTFVDGIEVGAGSTFDDNLQVNVDLQVNGSATVNGSMTASGGVIAPSITSPSGNLSVQRVGTEIFALSATGLLFPKTVAGPSFGQSAQTTDVATNSITFTPQPAFVTATTNKTPGSAIFALQDPSNSGGATLNPFVEVLQGGRVMQLFGARRDSTASSYGAIWLGNGVTPSTASESNMCFGSDGTAVSFLNAPANGTLYLTVGVSAFLGIVMTPSSLTFANTAWALAAGTVMTSTGDLSLNSSNSANAVRIKITSTDQIVTTLGSIVISPPTFQFASSTALPSIGQASTSSGNGAQLGIAAQSTTALTSTGGALALAGGSGTSTNGSILFKTGGLLGTLQFTIAPSLLTIAVGQLQQVDHTTTWASTTAIDWSTGNVQEVTLGGASTTFTWSNFKAGSVYYLVVIQDGTGGRGSPTYPATAKFPGGTAPTMTATANKRDIMTFVCNGTNLYLSALEQNL